jgi:hypothetical protein
MENHSVEMHTSEQELAGAQDFAPLDYLSFKSPSISPIIKRLIGLAQWQEIFARHPSIAKNVD